MILKRKPNIKNILTLPVTNEKITKCIVAKQTRHFIFFFFWKVDPFNFNKTLYFLLAVKTYTCIYNIPTLFLRTTKDCYNALTVWLHVKFMTVWSFHIGVVYSLVHPLQCCYQSRWGEQLFKRNLNPPIIFIFNLVVRKQIAADP